MAAHRAAAPIVYVALLRGINVGGNNMVSMASLKANFERLGFEDVSSYINSGNILFRAAERDGRKLEATIDRMLAGAYQLTGGTVVRSHAEFGRLVKTIAKTWQLDPAWRYNVIFLRSSIDSKRVLDGVEVKPEIEQVTYCPGTLLWSAHTSALSRTGMLKLSSRAIYKEMTVRNVNTTNKIFERMQRMQENVP